MPRNGSGTYSLPAGNPVVAGTTIDAAWANDTMNDLANEITNSLSRTGAGGMLAPFRIADGAVSAPGLSFLNETNTGIYRAGSGEMWLTVGGVAVAQVTANGLLIPSGKRISLPTPANTTDAANKGYVDDLVNPVIQYANYYLGPKSSDPSVNNSGGALTAGTTYWSTTLNQMRVYNGSIWQPMPSTASLQGQTFSGTGAQTAFTLAAPTGNATNLEVFISGVRQVPTTDYTVSGTTLTFTSAPPSGTNNIYVRFAQLLTLASADSSNVSYLPSGTGAVATTVQSKLRETVSVKDFGAKGDGVTDDTAAIQAAVTAAIAASHATVVFPPGGYKVTGTITIGEGVVLMGQGSQGSTESFGVSITHYSNSDLFKFDGSGTDFRGTGGGVKNMLLLKATGYSGGSAIYCYATSDNKRPGEMLSENVLIYGIGTGLWSTPIKIDGANANTAGARGVRTTVWIKCRASSASLYGWHLKQATHFYAFGCAFDTGGGSSSVGVYMEGINDGVYWEGCGIAGSWTIVANDASNTTNNFHFSGKIGGSITINDAQINGTIQVANSGGGIAIKSKSLRLLADNPPEFLATRVTVASNVTGDNTTYQVAFDNEVFDTLNNFGTNTFTCTVAGKYHFTAGVAYNALGAAHTRSDITIVKTGSPVRSIADVCNPYAQAAGGGNLVRSLSCTLDLAYGDTVYVNAVVAGSTKTVNVYGTSGTDYTWFSGKYLP